MTDTGKISYHSGGKIYIFISYQYLCDVIGKLIYGKKDYLK